MNIDDVKPGDVPTYGPDALQQIYARQRSLMEKYHAIEEKNGLLLAPQVPVELDDRFGQARLKDFAWRVTEELTESTEALSTDYHHAREEAVDALHFLVELFILADLSPVELASSRKMAPEDLLQQAFDFVANASVANASVAPGDDPIVYAYYCIESLGKAMNCLKQKPWKQTHILTDRARFHDHLTGAFFQFIAYSILIGHTGESLFAYYFKKSEVNKFRQRSGY